MSVILLANHVLMNLFEYFYHYVLSDGKKDHAVGDPPKKRGRKRKRKPQNLSGYEEEMLKYDDLTIEVRVWLKPRKRLFN